MGREKTWAKIKGQGELRKGVENELKWLSLICDACKIKL
jgi:hypothetical protein